MSDLNAQAASGRTIRLIKSKAGLNLVELPKNYADIFRDAGARTAYTIRNRKLVPVMYFAASAKNFADSATRWEMSHSKLVLGDGAGRTYPLVNADGLVIGHFGGFGSQEILVPSIGYIDQDLSHIVSIGNVFAEKMSGFESALTTTHYYQKIQRDTRLSELGKNYTEYVQPQQWFELITDPIGGVQFIISKRDLDGIVSYSVDILDLIEIPKLIYLAGKMVASKLIGSIIRRRLAKAAARGVGREIGEMIPKIERQYKNLTHADLIRWETQGGHMLQRHNPTLTEEVLLQIVFGPNKIPPEQFAKMTKEAKEAFTLRRKLSVWQKNKELASSR